MVVTKWIKNDQCDNEQERGYTLTESKDVKRDDLPSTSRYWKIMQGLSKLGYACVWRNTNKTTKV
jgi:hypothetical protein